AFRIGKLGEAEIVEALDRRGVRHLYAPLAQTGDGAVEFGGSQGHCACAALVRTVEHLKEHGGGEVPFVAARHGLTVPFAVQEPAPPRRQAIEVPSVQAHEYGFYFHALSSHLCRITTGKTASEQVTFRDAIRPQPWALAPASWARTGTTRGWRSASIPACAPCTHSARAGSASGGHAACS